MLSEWFRGQRGTSEGAAMAGELREMGVEREPFEFPSHPIPDS